MISSFSLFSGTDLQSELLLFTEGNICNRADIRHAVEATITRFGRFDSIVANAEIHRCKTFRK